MAGSIETWWNSVKDNEAWSGAYQRIDWADLWETAQENLKVIYESVHGD